MLPVAFFITWYKFSEILVGKTQKILPLTVSSTGLKLLFVIIFFRKVKQSIFTKENKKKAIQKYRIANSEGQGNEKKAQQHRGTCVGHAHKFYKKRESLRRKKLKDYLTICIFNHHLALTFITCCAGGSTYPEFTVTQRNSPCAKCVGCIATKSMTVKNDGSTIDAFETLALCGWNTALAVLVGGECISYKRYMQLVEWEK